MLIKERKTVLNDQSQKNPFSFSLLFIKNRRKEYVEKEIRQA